MKKVISIDWLSFSYNLSLTKEEYLGDEIKMFIPEDCSAEFLDGTKVFNRRMVVRDLSGRKILTLLYDPKSSLIPKEFVYVKLPMSVYMMELGVVFVC